MNFKKITLLMISFLMLISTSVFAAEIEGNKNYFFIESGSGLPTEDMVEAQQTFSEAEVYQRMMALQAQYPEGMPWTNDNEYISQGLLKDNQGYVGLGGAGCHAFALILSDAAFGNAPFYEHNNPNQIRVGDILRVYNNTHSVIVLEVHPDNLVIAEGNYNSSIHWGRTISRGDLVTDFIWTRYGQPVPSPAPSIDNETAIYRLYNPLTGEHLYTSDYGEMVILVTQHGWGDEGVGWYAPTTGQPVYRLYNPILDDHLYTSSQEEKDQLTSSYGWSVDNSGNPLFYSGGNAPVYRLYNPGLSRHLLTISDYESSVLVQTAGWNSEGIALYCIN